MFTAEEQKIVASTLKQRRSWVKGQLDKNGLETKLQSEYQESLRLLDGALQKVAPTANQTLPANNAQSKKAASNPFIQAPQKTITYSNARILIAEDNKDSAKLLLEQLQDMGFKFIDCAEDGISAFDKIKKATKAYDLILCDWDMPGITGLEVYTKAKASNTLKNAHFMMVTAVSEAARIKQAIQLGIADYIVKPIDADALQAKIVAALDIQEGEDQDISN